MQLFNLTVTDSNTAEFLTNLIVTADSHMDAVRVGRNLVDDGRQVMLEAHRMPVARFLGDDQAPLCSEPCAAAWEQNNADADHDGDGYVQTAGFIHAIDADEAEEFAGHTCAHCARTVG